MNAGAAAETGKQMIVYVDWTSHGRGVVRCE